MKKYFLFFFFLFLISGNSFSKEYHDRCDGGSTDDLLGTQVERNINTKDYIHVFISLKNINAKEFIAKKYGVKFNVRSKNTFTALVPIKNFRQLKENQLVSNIQLSSYVCQMMDNVKLQTNLNKVYLDDKLSTSYKGKGVLIGVIDAGFDYTHPNFRDKNGNSRIINVWQQNGPNDGSSSFGYGNILSSPEKIQTAKYDTRFDTHGTHVTGIAAGSADNIYSGIAPEADIALVSTNKTEQGIVDGVAYLLKYAEKLNRPIAINISIGTMLGYKDGSGLMASMIDDLLVNRKGCLVAVAMGNEGNRNSTLKGNNVKSIVEMSKQGANQVFIEGEKDKECKVTICLRNISNGTDIFRKEFNINEVGIKKYDDFGTTDDKNESLVVDCRQHEVTHKPSLYISFAYSKAADEEWIIEMKAANSTPIAYCNIGSFISKGIDGYSEGTSASTMAMTATGKQPIAVGAYVSRNEWTSLTGQHIVKNWEVGSLYPLSGKGPTSDNRIKPDIVAPGAAVVSSFSSYTNYQFTTINPKTDQVYSEVDHGRKYYWGVESGTSMATPVVTGILALMLQINPALTASEAKNIIQSSALKELNMGTLPNSLYGAGKIDAYQSLKKLVETTSIFTTRNEDAGYLFDRKNNIISFDRNSTAEIYNINGVMVDKSDNGSLDLTSLMKGVYILKISKHGKSNAYKILM